ncbi:ATP/GTP-binding protein, partial [Methanothrix sp.]|uniref:AAA family ATPase n=1 Tax=Methanothrix sp. TaxID=90426 RepID=UPI003743F1CC
MLLEFSVSNFLSIKDEITLSMVASTDKFLSKNTIQFNKNILLKSVAIYGPNASGKTNILYA